MVESFVGILIAVTASTSLLISIAISNRAIKNSGIQKLLTSERRILNNAGFNEIEIQTLEDFIQKIDLESL